MNMPDSIQDKILETERTLKVNSFTVSASIRNIGASQNRDTFLSTTFSRDGLVLSDLPLHVFVAERKISMLVLLDAVAKGIITDSEMRSLREQQEANYTKLLTALGGEKK